jgi:hypothetical protein
MKKMKKKWVRAELQKDIAVHQGLDSEHAAFWEAMTVVRMYIYTHKHYIYVYIHTQTLYHTRTHAHTHTRTHTHTHTHTHTRLWACARQSSKAEYTVVLHPRTCATTRLKK